ncbi:MAG TPA: hypothetical protein VE404_00910 [Verrucomicrobiae bacterium]|nr:hypothetical protein [Verrucomicrobiae bacterium]
MLKLSRTSIPRFLLAGISVGVVGGVGVVPVRAAVKEVIDQIVTVCDGHDFRLLVDLHLPEPGGQPAPALDIKGWRHNDTARPLVLKAGEDVKVTAVLNYGDKGVVLEISGRGEGRSGEQVPHLRVRFTAEAGGDKPDVQATELTTLILKVLRPALP